MTFRAFSTTGYRKRKSPEKPSDAHSKVLTEKETLYEFECECLRWVVVVLACMRVVRIEGSNFTNRIFL